MEERHEHEPIAESLPEAIRAELEEMRAVAQPYLDRIVAEFDANPRTLLERLPAVRTARAVEDEQVQLALLAAVMERSLDSRDRMWHTLNGTLQADAARRDREMIVWLLDHHPVIGGMYRAAMERGRAAMEAQLEALATLKPADPPWSHRFRTRPLPPHLDERLERHRLVAQPWLDRIDARDRTVVLANQEAIQRQGPIDAERLRAAAEDGKGIARDLKGAPGDVHVSLALVALYDGLNGHGRTLPGMRGLWAGLNRRALPYEVEDLELVLDLLDGYEIDGNARGWVLAPQLVRAIERYAASGGAIPERWLSPLRALLAHTAGSRSAEHQKMAVAIRLLLGTIPTAPTRLDLSPIDGPDVWSTTVRERLSERFGDDAGLNPLIGMLQSSGSGPRPAAAWGRRIVGALDASASSRDALRVMLQTAVEVRDELVRRGDTGNWLCSTLPQGAALQIRAAAWAAQLSDADWAPELLERLAARYAELLFNGEPHSGRVANGAVSALALLGGRDSIVRLSRLQRLMWHGGMRKHVERELDGLAAAAGLTRGQLLELSAPDLGLGDDGACTLTVGRSGSLTLSLDERCRLVTRWDLAGGESGSASPPRALRSAEPERVQELQKLVKQARASLAAERDRVDGMLAEQPRWALADWLSSYGRQPVLRALGRTLVWNVEVGDEARAGMPGDDGTFVDVDGVAFTAPSEAELTLWHPVAVSEDEVAAWRSALFERRLGQPVRQVFREVYRPTKDERGSSHSTRFSGHLLVQRPFRGLLKRRGWTAPALLTWNESGFDPALAQRIFPGFGVRAELIYTAVWTEEALEGIPGGYQLVSTGRLRFTTAGPKQGDALPFEDVPALVLSEAMRDVDLFVSVCSVALDPAWRDAGDEEMQLQWRELAFGELVESARIRRQLLERALPELSIADRCAVYDRELVVEGRRATYRIHLGSSQVRVDPHGSLLVVPRARAGAAELARLFLPVETDDTLAAVLGTAFLLANDDAITDETFTSQFPADGG
jgi:hypothetical protein